jgi:hypothetical protein
MMVPTFKSKTLITDLYSMTPPDSRGDINFLPPYIWAARAALLSLIFIAFRFLDGITNYDRSKCVIELDDFECPDF